MFKDKIWVEKSFQTSVNIAYDLNNENKIRDFIPTAASIDVVEDILLSTSTGAANRARILIGAYGKGSLILCYACITSLKGKLCSKVY